jgi:hypothetical protein
MIRGQIRDAANGPAGAVIHSLQEYGYARQMCSKAYQLLQQEGILARFPGLGYSVC